MELQRYFNLSNKNIGWDELEKIINDNYDIEHQVEKILEFDPESEIVVKFNLTIEVR